MKNPEPKTAEMPFFSTTISGLFRVEGFTLEAKNPKSCTRAYILCVLAFGQLLTAYRCSAESGGSLYGPYTLNPQPNGVIPSRRVYFSHANETSFCVSVYTCVFSIFSQFSKIVALVGKGPKNTPSSSLQKSAGE